MTTPTTSAVTPTEDKTGQMYKCTLRFEDASEEVVLSGRVAFSAVVGHKSFREHGERLAMVAFWRFIQ